jgi:hypothetical protein
MTFPHDAWVALSRIAGPMTTIAFYPLSCFFAIKTMHHNLEVTELLAHCQQDLDKPKYIL